MKTIIAKAGRLAIGGDAPIVVQTMCNTHTADIEASFAQCVKLAEAGAGMIRLTTPSLSDVEALAKIKSMLRERGIDTPLVADIHFRSDVAHAAAKVAEKVRVNPGNFHKDPEKAVSEFVKLMDICKEYGTAIRIGVNHGSLGEHITAKYGNTPQGMAEAAMEWLRMCIDHNFYNVVISLKASNTVVMVQAYETLVEKMKEMGLMFPLHLGVTEAGNADAGRIKSAVGIASLLEEGLGDTIRVSLTEDPVAEMPAGYSIIASCPAVSARIGEHSGPESSAWDQHIIRQACLYGPKLLKREIDDFSIESSYGTERDAYLKDEIMQAARRRFYRPEYIACPGCGRTMYNLEATFEEVKARTSHLKDVCIAVMGCIVNGPGEMADADYGYVGEGRGLVSIYKGRNAIYRHVPENEAIDKLLELIEKDRA